MKSKILLDNATLTSIQRALGYISVQNDSVFDLEIANLSNFCEALLLNEELYIPHDLYQSNFVKDRKDLFNEIGVKNLIIDSQIESDINDIASASFSRWYFDYKDDQSGLFNRVMELMDIYMRFVWNFRSSEYWLVMRAFQSYEGNKGGRIPIFESLLTDNNKKIWAAYKKAKSHDIVDSIGRILSEDKLKSGYNTMPGPNKMIAAMSWNIYRSIYYRIVATFSNCIYYPHSLRGIGAVLDSITVSDKHINEDTLSKYGFPNSSKSLTDSFEDILEKQKSELFEVGAIHGSSTFAIPPILGYVLSKTKHKEDFFEVLLKLKENSRIINLRSELREFEDGVRKGDLSETRKWKNKLSKTSIAVRKEMGIDESRFELNPLSYISGGMVNECGLSIPIPKSLNRIIAKPTDWSLWYREVALTLRNVARLGKEYDKLRSWAHFLDRESYNWYSKNDYPMKYTHTLERGIQ